jgi:regulator of RNase E activity RraA
MLPSAVQPLVARMRLLGRAVTADALGDLMSVLAALKRGGPGDVLVLAGGTPERALLGELLATEALRRGMIGIVIDGLCRDIGHLVKMSIPVFARGVSPRAADAKLAPIVQVPVLGEASR